MNQKERKAFIERFDKSNRAVSERYLGGVPLFDNEIGPYDVWEPNHQRGIRNAKTIVKMSKMDLRSLKLMAKLVIQRRPL